MERETGRKGKQALYFNNLNDTFSYFYNEFSYFIFH